MQSELKITVITCTFNAAEYISRTLDSVFQQTYPHVEHLIIDGLSTDNTMDIVNDYEEENIAAGSVHQVHIVSEPDKGLYDAMNKSLRQATGDYLVFLNAGDTFPEKNTLEEVAKAADGEIILPGVIYGDTNIVDENGKFVRPRHLQPCDNMTWRSFSDGMLVCHQAFYALTSIARYTQYNLKYRYSADVDWCIRIMKQSEKEHRNLKRVSVVVANFLDGGMTTANHRASLVERFRIMQKHYGLMLTVLKHFKFLFR